MKHPGTQSFAIGLLLIFMTTSLAGAAMPTTLPSDHTGYRLVWSDEFNGKEIDRTKWAFDTGNGFAVPTPDGKTAWVAGWGNNELENYTDRPQNAFVRDGMLHLRAIKEEYQGSHYTSARMRTGGKGQPALFTKKYGKFEFRAKLPTGQGLWPALWFLPQEETYGGWAGSGEMDLMEARGSHTDLVQATLHFGQPWPKNVWSGQQFRLPNHGTISDFHIYTLDWEPGEIRASVDDNVYFKRNFWYSKTKPDSDINEWPAPFNQPFYILMNVAVGGQFGGDPDKTTNFPQEMVVDYVRAYEKSDRDGAIKPRGSGDINAPSSVGQAGG